MPSTPENQLLYKTVVATEGLKAELTCTSNDENHNFMLWILGSNNNTVVGPGSHYDESKYKYEILSGKLHINSVSANEAGVYTCLSKNLSGVGYYAEEIELFVKDTLLPLKLVAIVFSIIVLISCAVLYYRMRREGNKYDEQTMAPVDEVEDDDGEEIYNQTTTSINQPHPATGPSRNPSSDHLLYGIDNQGLDTDFNSVFENIQIKSPVNTSLI